MVIRANTNSARETKYLFVDGGCLQVFLRTISKKYFNGDRIDVKYEHISSSFTKTFYYDSLLPQKKEEDDGAYKIRIQPQQDLFDSLRQIDGWHVHEGVARERKKAEDGIEQKQVDILIAVHMLTHSFNRNMDQATLLTSDLDFKPLLDALVQGGMYITLWHPKGNTNKELRYAADGRRELTLRQAHGWASPEWQLRHPLPQAVIENGANQLPDDVLLRTWTNKHGFEVQLHKGGSGYTLITPAERSPQTQILHIRHTNLDMLELYTQETYPYIEWQ